MKKYNGRILVLGLLLGAALTLSPQATTAAASEHELEVSHRFRASDASVEVSHRVRVQATSGASLESIEYALPVENASDITVEYGGGSAIPFSSVKKRSSASGLEFEHTSLVLDFPNEPSGDSWEFIIRYETEEGVRTLGDSRILLLPFLDGRVDAAWSATVVVPSDWPMLNYRPQMRNFNVEANSRELIFANEDYRRAILALSFSADTKHQITMEHELRNSSLLPKLMPFTLPLDTHSQEVTIEDLQPRPARMEVDSDGNAIAYYRMWPWQTRTITYEADVLVRQLRYDGSDSTVIEETEDEFAPYLQPGDYWPLDGVVAETSNSVIDEDDSAWAVTLKLTEYIQDEVPYTHDDMQRLRADEVLELEEATAENIADTLVAMLRSQGVPARLIYGYVHPSTALHTQADSHVWVEAYVQGVGWVNLDPVWARVFGSNGYSSIDRIGVAAISNDSQAKLRNSLDSTPQIEPVGVETEAEGAGDEQRELALEYRQYMLLPGFELRVKSVENLLPHIIDEVVFDGMEIGSMAPGQIEKSRYWYIGGWGADSVVAHLNEQEFSAESERNWWPLGGLAILGVSVGVIQFYRWRRREYIRKRLHGKVLR